MKSIKELADSREDFRNKENLSESEKQRYEEEQMDKMYGEEDSGYSMHYKGIFVDILKDCMRTKKKIKVSSFTHKNVACVVLECNSRYVVLRSLMNGKKIYLTQASIKDIEEI